MILSFIIILALSILSATLSWLYQDRERSHKILATDFTLRTDVYYLQSDNTKVSAENYRDPQTGYYIVNISAPAAPNYAPKLRIDVRYQGITKSYLRVYVNDMWLINNESIFKMDTVFVTAPGLWTDNRLYDKYYYYTAGEGEERGLVSGSTPQEQKTYSFISGIQDFGRISNGVLYLEIKADAVQLNRMEAFWGMTQLP